MVIALRSGKVSRKCVCTLGLDIVCTFGKKGSQVYWLLAGGDKSSQKRGIEQAKALRREVEEMNNDKNE